MPRTTTEGPTVSLSFANNFWGKDDAGVAPLLDRMHNAKVTGDELKAFYAARAELEADYAKKLLNLARKPLGSYEAGTLRMSLDVVRAEVESMGKQHQHVAQQMKTELEEPLASFHGGLKERRKIVQNGIEKLLKTKMQQAGTVNKTRDRFEQDCLKIKGYLAQGHMVMGQEERKNKAKLEKTQIQMSQTSGEYETAVKVLEETTGRWNREWKAACDKFQDLEEERIDYFKSSLWQFANIASTVCVSDDQSCEKIRLSLEDCDVEKDITGFIKDRGTGQEIPDPPRYINFCRGDGDDSASQAGSDAGEYSVAQFQRTMNPAFRSSSPQPSMLESHHDPDNGLRDEMGIPNARSSLQGEEAFAALRSSQGSAHMPTNLRSSQGSSSIPAPLAPQAQLPSTISKQVDSFRNAPQVPHNPYPADGMTQFCRPAMGPPSERSSIPSPERPSSRDSNTDQYSNPSSFTSIEPDGAMHSPIKGYNDSALSGMSNGSDIGQPVIAKKKSGFFNSPFRRRSNKRLDEPQQQVGKPAPTARNTWTPANTGRQAASAGSSPIKPLAHSGRASTWGQKQPSPSQGDVGDDPNEPGYQLGIGNNVFDVASPDKRHKPPPPKSVSDEMDPIAQALADLRNINKQASSRQSADRHYGMSTPAPPRSPGPSPGANARGVPAGAVPTPFARPAHDSPPPGYEPSMSRLGAPQPAHTKKEMQRTTERFVTQKHDMFSAGANRSQHPRSQSAQAPPPRATSPAPLRATSPRPFSSNPGPSQQPFRAASPNPHGGADRPRAQSNSPIKPQPNYASYQPGRGSSGYQMPRATSPSPAYNRPPAGTNGGSRPASSRGSDQVGGSAMVLAPAGPDAYGSQRGGRPQSQYYGNDSGHGNQQMAVRTRSQSMGAQRQYTKEGRPILHYSRAMYMYQAAIAEELSFAKGDILAVLRLQDDGWWEAEVVGKSGRPGLVPSNYLKNC